ncbi:MAG: transketolase [Candidatus Caenarcaniphilales bacterium]|nr:transketolase [Candidatus Caenarcaniphilales bacterium]
MSNTVQTNLNLVKEKALEIRINSLKMIHAAKSGHPGGSLSIADLLSSLYFGGHMKYNPQNPQAEDRDILVVSKGHSSPAVYSTLGLAGFFNIEETINFRKLGSPFQGHIDSIRVPGVEISTGSLGHGLSNANGFAIAAKLDNNKKKVFAILSDGELQEGQSWEAFMAAAHFKLDNLVAIIDRNRIQLDGWTEETMALDSLEDKLKAFNWNTLVIDGHNPEEIDQALNKAYELAAANNMPVAIIANTVKGKGVSFMEDQVSWHGVAPKDEDLAKALEELK